MKVERIQHYTKLWTEDLRAIDHLDNAFYLDVVDHWQAHWDIDDIDFGAMYNRSLESSKSARLWGGNTNSPKSMMLAMIGVQKEYMRTTFRDLFREDLDLGLRLDRMAYHADQVLAEIQRKDRRVSTHYHHDRRYPCLYLALEMPDMYCLWDYPRFDRMMQLLESRNIPLEVEVERYYKSCRAINKLMRKDGDLMSELRRLTAREEDQIGLMMINLFMEYLSSQEST